jgi:hypothetical protein
MRISELVKDLLEMQKDHGDLEVFSSDEKVVGMSYYPEDETQEAFVYLESG